MGGPTKGPNDHFVMGDWNVACSMCGRKLKASQAVKNWQGQWRCPEHNEPRQSQDFVRAIPDVQSVPFAQPETDLDIYICSINGVSAIPDEAIPNCSIPDNPIFFPDLSVTV